jgi:hypothetical protein
LISLEGRLALNLLTMTRIKLLFPVAIICLFLISCSKEKSVDSSTNTPGGPGGSGNSLTGNWQLVGIHISTKAVIEMEDAGMDVKTITYSDYDTKDNQGTMKITTNTMESVNWGYSVDDVAIGYFYENDVLIDSLEFPLVVTTPATSFTNTYKLIGADSIAYQGTAAGNGARYKIENDILTITSYISTQSSGLEQGIPYTQTNSGKAVTRLQRQ